jgi:hypothetical protein
MTAEQYRRAAFELNARMHELWRISANMHEELGNIPNAYYCHNMALKCVARNMPLFRPETRRLMAMKIKHAEQAIAFSIHCWKIEQKAKKGGNNEQ